MIALIVIFAHSSRPVSYTHLDVYKRQELEITLTGKNCGLEERAPMCGVPYHAVDSYLNRLVSKGYKVAICEQVEDPATAKGIVKREVVRIATPGTNLDTQALDETKNNYLMCVAYIADPVSYTHLDVYKRQEEYGHSPRREYAFLIAHSVLHLCGYDHMEEEERLVMEQKQREILEKLEILR